MKKRYYLLLLLLAGCGQSNSEAPKTINTVDVDNNGEDFNIIASWINEPGDVTLTFNRNSTYLYKYNDGDFQFSENGTYSITGKKVNATDSDGYSYTETFMINNNKLTLTDEYGYSQNFARK